MRTGLVSHIQRYSLHDGPGIRTTVFLKGCPLDCWWCHNPENRATEPEVLWVKNRCVQCGVCTEVCPGCEDKSAGETVASRAIPPELTRERCQRCGKCVAACPTGARHWTGERMPVKKVMAEVAKDLVFYEESGGGVTFSGGEPLLQFEFLIDLLAQCKKRGVHTALDTCGYAPSGRLLEASALASLLLYDVKFVDEARHRRFTGVSNRLILDNLSAVSRLRTPIWLRIPVIPGVNDDEKELRAMAHLAATTSGVKQVNLLPYHQTGVAKFERLGQEYRLAEVKPPSAVQMEMAKSYFTALGLDTKISG